MPRPVMFALSRRRRRDFGSAPEPLCAAVGRSRPFVCGPRRSKIYPLPVSARLSQSSMRADQMTQSETTRFRPAYNGANWCGFTLLWGVLRRFRALGRRRFQRAGLRFRWGLCSSSGLRQVHIPACPLASPRTGTPRICRIRSGRDEWLTSARPLGRRQHHAGLRDGDSPANQLTFAYLTQGDGPLEGLI